MYHLQGIDLHRAEPIHHFIYIGQGWVFGLGWFIEAYGL
jgi:hypothetical protein